MLKSAFRTAVLCALLIVTASTFAADRPNEERNAISNSTLADLGLSGILPMSDLQGHQIRGRAFEGTPGNGSFTTLPTALSKEGLGVIGDVKLEVQRMS